MMKAKVLLVDDDLSLLKLLSIRLRSEDYDVQTASSGREALQRIEQQRPDVVLSDLRMDEMDGLALFDEIHHRWMGLPMIIMTAHGSISDAVAATRSGVFSFLTKPIAKEELTQALKEALQQTVPQQQDRLTQVFVTRSPAMTRVLEQAARIAQSDINVLLIGARGTGKTLMGKMLHQISPRAKAPWIEIDCRVDPELLQRQLFGDGEQSPSGFERAHGGTLFLDEVGALPASIQDQLVESLNEAFVHLSGERRNGALDVRLISASQEDLVSLMDQGLFREDLFYRLNVANIKLPQLTKRLEDIPVLAKDILKKYQHQSPVRSFSAEALSALAMADWPGNVLQLQNLLYQAISLSTSPVISGAAIHQLLPQSDLSFPTLQEARNAFEKDYLIRVLKLTLGNVKLSAELSGRNRTDFYKLLHRHQVDVVQFKGDK